MSVPIQTILSTVFQSILQVFLLCLAGFTLSFNGIVDKPTSKVLNHINVAFFTPALLFSKVAYFLTPAKLRQLWVIPIFFVVLTGLSALVAHSLARACRLRRSQVNFAIAASMFMNSNSLPVALMQSLVSTVPLLKWGPNDTIDAMFGRSLTYLVVFSTLGMILRWSYGVRLLSQADEPESPIIPPPTTYRDADDTVQHPLIHVAVGPSTTPNADPLNRHMSHRHPLRPRLHSRLTPLSRRHTHPHVHHSLLPAVPTSLGDQSESEDTDDLDTSESDSEDTLALRSEPNDTGFSTEVEDNAPVRASPLPSSSSENAPRWDRPDRHSVFQWLHSMFKSLSPPLVASLTALFCVLVPPVQQLLQSEGMISFTGALDNAGACSIPLTLLVLGGWFWDGQSTPRLKHTHISEVASDCGQGNVSAKRQGRGKDVTKYHVTARHVDSYSRNSSTTSLSSMIGTFGDMLMGRIYSRRSARFSRTRRRAVGGSAGVAGDVESGPQSAAAYIESEHAEHRSRAQTDAVMGHAHQFSSSPLPTPLSPSSLPPVPRSRSNPPGETLTVIVALLARMVLTPLVAIPLMVLVGQLGWGGEVFEDPVFIVSSMLLITSPPALTLAQISQSVKSMSNTSASTAAATTTNNGATDTDAFSPFERLLSRTVFWAYLILTPPLTIVSVMVGLLLVES